MDHLILLSFQILNLEKMNLLKKLKKKKLELDTFSLYESLDLPPSTAII